MNAGLRCSGLEAKDIEAAARLHRHAFPQFFLSSLGHSFLTEFYRGFLVESASVAKVVKDGDQLVGVVVGTLDPAGFFSRLLKRRWFKFALAASGALLRKPSILPRLFRAVWYRGGSPIDRRRALLSSIAVSLELQRSGVGKLLVSSWLEEVRARGAAGAYLTTDAIGNDRVNRFYQKCGWTVESQFVTPEGRKMNRYIYDIIQK